MYEFNPRGSSQSSVPSDLGDSRCILAHYSQCAVFTFASLPRALEQHSYPSPTPRSLNLQVPALHSSDLLIDSFLQGFDRFVHADMSTPRVHGET